MTIYALSYERALVLRRAFHGLRLRGVRRCSSVSSRVRRRHKSDIFRLLVVVMLA